MGKINNNNENNNSKKLETILMIVMLIIAVGTVIIINVIMTQKNKEKELPYTELISYITDEKIEKIEMTTGR